MLGSALIGGLGSYFGSRSQNEANSAISARQMDFQREANAKAMAFTERMSNTQYQRGMADMKKAGLNPILAYRQGGASSPTGVTSGGAGIPAKDEIGAGVRGGLAAASAVSTIKLQKQQVKNVEAQTRQTEVNSAYRAAELSRFIKYGDSVVGRQADSAAKIGGRAVKTSTGATKSYLESKKAIARKQGWMKPKRKKWRGYNTSPSH